MACGLYFIFLLFSLSPSALVKGPKSGGSSSLKSKTIDSGTTRM